MCSPSGSLPALGTGQGNVQAWPVADAMPDTVIEVMDQCPSTALKKIRIVIFQDSMPKELSNSMQPIKASQPQLPSQGFLGNIGSKIRSFLHVGSASKSKIDRLTRDPPQCEPTCFHICGDSPVMVNMAKHLIHNLMSKECSSMCISDNTILSFTNADYLSLDNIQRNMGVSIKTESKNFQASITIEGSSQCVIEASKEVRDVLRKARDERELKKKVELTRTRVKWQYGRGRHSFDAKTNVALEEALEKKQSCVLVKIEHWNHKVNLPDGPAADSKGRILPIKRIDNSKGEDLPSSWDAMPTNTSTNFITIPASTTKHTIVLNLFQTTCKKTAAKILGEDLPSHWDAMPANATNHSVTIPAGTTEHTAVLNLFRTTCKKTVTKIERIQNPLLWQTLQIKKQDMDRRNGRKDNLRHLFHGTCFSTVPIINKEGFNRSYAGKNSASYGKGTYFAVDASYSAWDTFSKPNAQGEKCMYLCCVLTGEFIQGEKRMIAPPNKSDISHEKYDSVVDNMSSPSMFVVFHDTQAYPEYLITFK